MTACRNITYKTNCPAVSWILDSMNRIGTKFLLKYESYVSFVISHFVRSSNCTHTRKKGPDEQVLLFFLSIVSCSARYQVESDNPCLPIGRPPALGRNSLFRRWRAV